MGLGGLWPLQDGLDGKIKGGLVTLRRRGDLMRRMGDGLYKRVVNTRFN